uniref:ABC transporter permease subunit n=1 Tax=Pseudomonas viridiflava TaxID=33069 RepID=UPI003C72ABDE
MFTAAIISGLGLGSVYALLALGFHLTYVVSRTVNFAHRSGMSVGDVLGYTGYVHGRSSVSEALPLTLS